MTNVANFFNIVDKTLCFLCRSFVFRFSNIKWLINFLRFLKEFLKLLLVFAFFCNSSFTFVFYSEGAYGCNSLLDIYLSTKL